jgi:hypothetical protein
MGNNVFAKRVRTLIVAAIVGLFMVPQHAFANSDGVDNGKGNGGVDNGGGNGNGHDNDGGGASVPVNGGLGFLLVGGVAYAAIVIYKNKQTVLITAKA